MSSSPWIELAQATEPERHGGKAVRLGRALRDGLPVPRGWVLPCKDAARAMERPELLRHAARSLLARDAPGWMLRSSSPLEDQRAFSAAGLLHSQGAEAVPEDVEEALRAVIASATKAARAFGSKSVPIAVLAQPRLRLQTWLTLELDDELRRAEGWTSDGQALRFDSREDADEHARELVDLALRTGPGPRLVEAGHDGNRAWLLQVRPAVSLSPRARTCAEEVEAPAPPRGLGLRVHPGDAGFAWTWDAEHSPTPLCPLLAGHFGEWLADGPASYPSRLHHGRWHDRPVSSPDLDFESAREVAREWESRTAPSLRKAVDALEADSDWNSFMRDWLAWQRRYFDERPAGLRSWARRILRDVDPLPPLPPTVASGRTEAWRELARSVESLGLPRSAEALAAWVQENEDHELARALRERLQCDGHLAAMPYDGRGRTWAEDPTPFWRTITGLREATPPDPRDASPRSPEVDLALRALALGEDDNDLLLRAYALFRRAARERAGDEDWEWILDLLPNDLRGAEDLREAAARGRALFRQWEAATPNAGSGPLRGTPASPGRAAGPVWRGTALSNLPEGEGWVATVPTVTPAEAHLFPRLAALVCEGGDVLGHASVLAREHGVPCVVGIAGARARLAGAVRALVDADDGRVEPMEAPEA